MSLFSTAELMDQLYGSFDVIYAQWCHSPPTSSHLWELTNGKSALKILEQDIVDIGTFFSAADAIGMRSEVYLMAECIAHLRAAHGTSNVTRKAEDMIDEIGEWLLHQTDHTPDEGEHIYSPLSYRIGQFACTQGIAREDTLNVLRKALLTLADHFLLRDGTITTQEDTRLKEFHAALK